MSMLTFVSAIVKSVRVVNSVSKSKTLPLSISHATVTARYSTTDVQKGVTMFSFIFSFMWAPKP